MDFESYIDAHRARVDAYLRAYIDGRCGEDFAYLKESMSYSLLSGGKRLRPVILLASCEACGGDAAPAMPFAAAFEMIHTFSLIHDDLPSMDDDDMRRNKPTNHKVFGEAHAILAGDALLTEAYRMMSDPALYAGLPASIGLTVMREVADAAGICGMVGGQSLDLLTENKSYDEATVQKIHACKTARFIAAATVAGALVARADENAVAALRAYGERVGLAFQIMDDILNETGESGRTGKAVGSDARAGKATYPALVGIDESRRRAAEYAREAKGALAPLGKVARRLSEIADFIVTRDS
ncbi:polyprenyl synthetase family protein [bacterium]|nr:polyprenyl synthetase family protein [bacterium]